MATTNALIFKNLRQDVKSQGGQPYKTIVNDISGGVKSGEILAILGPSGAGKTSLCNILTLNAISPGATCYGKCTLNGQLMTQKLFVEHCVFVEQLDSHRAFLTCRQTIAYAYNFYAPDMTEADKEAKVNELLEKLGLAVCAETRVGNQFIQGLSGGQKKRLSVALALIKKPEVMYLDEPTSGLDAAASANVMKYVSDLSKEYNIITVATIHQPSSSIYFSFDYVMLLSKGRLAYYGTPKNSIDYFNEIGYEMPAYSNPAEFQLDVINAEFTDNNQVLAVLDKWNEANGPSAKYHPDLEKMANETSGAIARHDDAAKMSWCGEFGALFKRQAILACIDPMIYLGRCIGFVFACTFFAVIYVESRNRVQEEILNRLWLSMWLTGVPTSFGVVAVFAFADEFKSICKEVKNGMYRLSGYLLSAFLIQIPAMFLLGLCAIGIPGFAIGNMYAGNFGLIISLYACALFSYECIARCFSVAFPDPLFGMLSYMNVWFTSFLFAGVMIPEEKVIWPFRVFVYILPLNWSIQSIAYLDAIDSTYGDSWTCSDTSRTDCLFHYGEDGTRRYPGWTCSSTVGGSYNPLQCYGHEGWQVLDSLGMNYGSITSTDYTARNFGVIVAIALAGWVGYMVSAYGVCLNVSRINDQKPPVAISPDLSDSRSQTKVSPQGKSDEKVALYETVPASSGDEAL